MGYLYMYGLTVHVTVLFYKSSTTSKIFAVKTIFRVVFHIMPLNSFETTEEVLLFLFLLGEIIKSSALWQKSEINT